MNFSRIFVLAALAVVSAQAMAADLVFIQVTGQVQGKFRGESPQLARHEWSPVVDLSMGVASPRDPATGLPSGKRQHSPIVITKEWGAASTQFFRALVTNENLPTVVLEFVRTEPTTGKEQTFERWTLKNASVADFKDRVVADEAAKLTRSFEDISLVYRSVEIENLLTHDKVDDNWTP